MNIAARIVTITILTLLSVVNTEAQRFVHLSAETVRPDSIMPSLCHTIALPDNYADSIYTASLVYPEYVVMTNEEVALYNKHCGEPLPSTPEIHSNIITSRKKASMVFTFSPYILRDGKYQILRSYAVDVKTTPAPSLARGSRASAASSRYADHSILATGRWAKIRVPLSGIYQLTEDVIRKAGFSDLSKVKIYGYGGNILPEVLSPAYITSHDDLQEVASCMAHNMRLFYAKGPVSWTTKTTSVRTRNPYSDYGYYFITQTEDEPLTTDIDALIEYAKQQPENYNTLYEVDNFAWYNGGRNLVNGQQIPVGGSRTYSIEPRSLEGNAYLTVCVSAVENKTSFRVEFNGRILGTASISVGQNDKANAVSRTYTIQAAELKETNEVKITSVSGSALCLDYISMRSTKVDPRIHAESVTYPAVEYVYNITNQDHHADSNVDMVIIIPTSQHLLEQANRLKEHHETFDSLSVRIVPADELYNEFSSGTPDVSAYRRYMKMLYDRAETEAETPKYLLLFGDCMWDNRLLTSSCRGLNADNMLLCFESENSYNEVNCFVSDDFLGMLDDNEAMQGSDGYYTGVPDVGVGRFPVMTKEEAKVMVDKTIAYATNTNAGAWQNTIMFMGDDGNSNMHMRDVDEVAENVINNHPGYNVRKVYWDAYKRKSSSTGHSYPDVERLVREQQAAGALIMDYAGHGAANSISHEFVLRLADFQAFDNANLPLWVTASCDIMPFDGLEATIGETMVLNPNGGSVAFYGTTRTVYANYNKYINSAFINNVLTIKDGRRMTLGEANRLAKQKLVMSNQDRTVNKMQYSLLGDPALALNVPLSRCVVDKINGEDIATGAEPTIHANSIVTVEGHVEQDGRQVEGMKGLVSAVVRDSREIQTCLNNAGDTEPFQFFDRTNNIFTGTDSIRDGRFKLQFAVPRDINYSDDNGLITLFAHNVERGITAHGESANFKIGGAEVLFNDSIGPSLHCYLNTEQFRNGDNVNSTPMFIAEITDKDGINATGSGIGHDMQLVVDGSMVMTYNLNSNFQFDFGSYTSGRTYYHIPQLSPGLHTLRFRAWDILNNSSTTELTFNVVDGLVPRLLDVRVTDNPARTMTSFVFTHDHVGSPLDVEIQLFDVSGRLLHVISQKVSSAPAVCTYDWDLTGANGKRFRTGVYLYRVRIASGGSSQTSKAGKLLIVE